MKLTDILKTYQAMIESNEDKWNELEDKNIQCIVNDRVIDQQLFNNDHRPVMPYVSAGKIIAIENPHGTETITYIPKSLNKAVDSYRSKGTLVPWIVLNQTGESYLVKRSHPNDGRSMKEHGVAYLEKTKNELYRCLTKSYLSSQSYDIIMLVITAKLKDVFKQTYSNHFHWWNMDTIPEKELGVYTMNLNNNHFMVVLKVTVDDEVLLFNSTNSRAYLQQIKSTFQVSRAETTQEDLQDGAFGCMLHSIGFLLRIVMFILHEMNMDLDTLKKYAQLRKRRVSGNETAHGNTKESVGALQQEAVTFMDPAILSTTEMYDNWYKIINKFLQGSSPLALFGECVDAFLKQTPTTPTPIKNGDYLLRQRPAPQESPKQTRKRKPSKRRVTFLLLKIVSEEGIPKRLQFKCVQNR